MKKEYSINPLLKLLVSIWMFFFTKRYKIKANISDEIKNLNEPYLLLSNHCGRYDPFIISHFIKKRPHFISSDAILRDKIIGTLFKMLGAMPKKKGVRDTVIIREMAKVVGQGGALALFPEGARTWNGASLFIDPSVVKLIRLLKIPVICAKMKGCYAYDPRWAITLRRAAMDIDFKLILQKDEVKSYSEESILQLINENLLQDDIEYQRTERIPIRSEKRAENADLVLYQCPVCKSFDGFDAQNNELVCSHCNCHIHFDVYGFVDNEEHNLPFDNLRDWVNWQNTNFAKHIAREFKNNTDKPLFTAKNMQIDFAVGSDAMQPIGNGEVSFYIDHLTMICEGFNEKLMLSDISALGPQYKERIELFHGDNAYRFTSTTKREPGLKWEIAANTIWALTEEPFKVSAYNQNLIEQAIAEL